MQQGGSHTLARLETIQGNNFTRGCVDVIGQQPHGIAIPPGNPSRQLVRQVQGVVQDNLLAPPVLNGNLPHPILVGWLNGVYGQILHGLSCSGGWAVNPISW